MGKTKLVIWAMALLLIAFVATFNYGGCGGGGGGGGGGGSSAPAIAAPSNLQASIVDIYGTNYIHLTWQDNSNNEIGFGIAVKPAGGGYFEDYDMPLANATSSDLLYPSAGTLYFKIRAVSESYTFSGYSNEVSIYYPGM